MSTTDYYRSLWNHRFINEENEVYEWHLSWSQLSGILKHYLRATDQILNLGVGNSLLCSDLIDAGYGCQGDGVVIGLDISPVVVQQLNQRWKEYNNHLLFEECNILDLESFLQRCDHKSFNIAIDKATMDALCTEDDKICMLNEVSKAIGRNGLFLSVSFSYSRLQWLQAHMPFDWQVQCHVVGDGDPCDGCLCHYVFVCGSVDIDGRIRGVAYTPSALTTKVIGRKYAFDDETDIVNADDMVTLFKD